VKETNIIFLNDIGGIMPSKTSESYPTKNTIWKQLLVLGNGFDLHCHLKSKYQDFFNTRNTKSILESKAPEGTNWGKYIHDQGMNIWDIILFGQADQDWCNIEAAIEEWVINQKHIRQVLRLANQDKDFSEIQSANLNHPEAATAEYICQTQDRRCWTCNETELADSNLFLGHHISIDNIYALLFYDLHQLESDFLGYLLDEIHNTAKTLRDIYSKPDRF
jgi:hypothetical protein